MHIKQIYKNKPVILIATGPSLTEEVVEIIRKYKDKYIIFGCNDSYRLIDFLDVFYACDVRWWNKWGDSFREKYPNLPAYTQSEEHKHSHNLTVVTGKHRSKLSTNPKEIHWGSNSGFQILNLALLFGCSKFILVGYNMQLVDGKSHFFGDHEFPLRSRSPYNKFIAAFQTVQEEVKPYIVNCTPNSALKNFRTNDLEDELRCE